MTSLHFSYSNHITEHYSSYIGTLEDLRDLISSNINYSLLFESLGFLYLKAPLGLFEKLLQLKLMLQ